MTEALAVALGFAYILLAIRQHRACWIAGGASSALYILVFLQAALPLQAMLQVVYVVQSGYGWFRWRPGGGAARPQSWPMRRHLVALAAVAAATAACSVALDRFELSAAPLAESLGATASIAATWMLARRCIESWLWWIAIDAGLAALFLSQELHYTAALYLAFAMLAVAGWLAWRRDRVSPMDPRIAGIAAELGLVEPAITALPGGLANRVLRLRDDREDLVLRLAGPVTALLGADRQSELAIHRLAAAAGLAPAIVLARPEQGVLVTRHVAGQMPTAEQFRSPAVLARAGAWLARLHAIDAPAGFPVVDFGERAAGYLEAMRRAAPAPALDAIRAALASQRAALPPSARLAACHHDLHHRNFVDTGEGLVVIDWEYAGPGDPAADLAGCAGYHRLDAAAIDALFAGYGADAALRERVRALAWIFDCLWYGWNGAAATAGLGVDPREQAALEARLRA